MVNRRLLLQNESLVAENRILRSHFPARAEGGFQVIMGKSIATEGENKCPGVCPNLRSETKVPAPIRAAQKSAYANESAEHLQQEKIKKAVTI